MHCEEPLKIVSIIASSEEFSNQKALLTTSIDLLQDFVPIIFVCLKNCYYLYFPLLCTYIYVIEFLFLLASVSFIDVSWKAQIVPS